MILSLPDGFRANIGNDLDLLNVCHEIFYLQSCSCLNITKSDVVLDCGANVGFFALYASRYTDKIVSVEPLSKNYRLLLDNINTNDLTPSVIPIKKAVFDEVKEMNLYGSGIHASFFSDGVTFEKVQCTTIDILEKSLDLKFDVLKIDVEGAEVKALRGADETLRHVREISIEYHSDDLRAECEDILNVYDFKVCQPLMRHGLRWVKGYSLLNFREIWNGRIPDLIEFLRKKISQRNKQENQGILYAKAVQ